MPRVEDIFSKLNGAKYFSTLNLHAGNQHIPLNEESIPKTAFTSPFGKYEYLKVPFGLAQAPMHVQELMNKVLKDLPFSIAYLDDIIIYSKTAEEHFNHLQHIFHNLCNAGLYIEIEQVSCLCQGNSIFGPRPQHYWYKSTTFQNNNY